MTKKRIGLVALMMVLGVAGTLLAVDSFAKYIDTVNIPVTVKIQKYYKVHFEGNGGAGTMADQEFTYNVPQALTANAFTREGFNFVGWSLSESGDGQDDLYADEEIIRTNLTDVGDGIVTLYAQWEEEAMHSVAEINGICVFHGKSNDKIITGTNCVLNGTDWADGTHTYIDTGVKLYNQDNYEKDYEIGFTIVDYDYNGQYIEPGDSASQVTFMNTKLEDSSRTWPGLVIRKSAERVEVTQTIGGVKKTTYANASNVVNVAVTRVDGKVYYSFNNAPFTLLQDMNGTSDYFDVSTWFGAAAKVDGTPMRFVDATLSNMYIKVGNKGANKHIVSFNAGGVTTNPQNVTVIGDRGMGSSLPVLGNYGGRYFSGWYTRENGEGDLITANTVITTDMTLYAYWLDNNDACSVGGETKGSLQECINIAGSLDTIVLQKDISEQVTVGNGKEIRLDLNGHTLSDGNITKQPVISNNGKLTIINGTVTSSLEAGVINNNANGELYIKSGARIIATGKRQAIYNDGGNLEISDNAYLSATSNERATVQNHTNGGTITIKGGTIIAANQQAVNNETGTLVIGDPDGVANADSPVIQGATYGVTTNTDISMYDGVLRGKTAAIDDPSRITASEPGAAVIGVNPEVTEIVDGLIYKILYYQQN